MIRSYFRKKPTCGTAGSMPATPACEQTEMMEACECQPTAAPPRKARRTGAAGLAAVQCSERAPRTKMAGARPILGTVLRRSTAVMNGRKCWPTGAHRLADDEVARGNLKNAEMLANGNPSQVITRSRTVSSCDGWS